MPLDDPILCTAVVVRRSGRVLLLRRSASVPNWPGHWCLPGGKDEPGETPEACAVRELREETGLVVAEEDLELIGRTETRTEDGRVYVEAVFLMEADRLPGFNYGKTMILDNAHNNWGVFGPGPLPRPMHPGAAEVLGWLAGDRAGSAGRGPAAFLSADLGRLASLCSSVHLFAVKEEPPVAPGRRWHCACHPDGVTTRCDTYGPTPEDAVRLALVNVTRRVENHCAAIIVRCRTCGLISVGREPMVTCTDMPAGALWPQPHGTPGGTCAGSYRTADEVSPTRYARPACPACGGPTVDRGAGVWCDRCHVKVITCCEGGRTGP